MVDDRWLVAHLIPSPKRQDLYRDPRYALHSFPAADNDAFYLAGVALDIPAGVLQEKAAAQFIAERQLKSEPEDFAAGQFFEFLVDRCLLTRTSGHGGWRPQHTTWANRG